MHHRTLRHYIHGKLSIEEWESEDGKSWHMISQDLKESCIDCKEPILHDTNGDQCEKCQEMSLEAEAWHIADYDGCFKDD